MISRFIGNDGFCFKWCKDDGPNAAGKCQHTLDRIGTSYNCPSKYTISGFAAGEFEVCDSDSFPIPGVYTDAAGATQSYAQPAESLGAISTMPYQPSSAATSNCKTFASTELFTTFGAAPTGASGSSASGTGTATSGASSGTGTRATAAPTSSGSSNSTGSSSATGDSGAAEAFGMSLFAAIIGTLAAVSMFA